MNSRGVERKDVYLFLGEDFPAQLEKDYRRRVQDLRVSNPSLEERVRLEEKRVQLIKKYLKDEGKPAEEWDYDAQVVRDIMLEDGREREEGEVGFLGF